MITVERIEGRKAVLDFGGKHLVIALDELPEGIKEGNVLRKSDEGFVIDKQSENRRRKDLAVKRQRIFGE